MTSEEIRIELFKRRKVASMAILARQLGVTRQAVYNTVDGRHKSMRIARAVADAIERPVEDVFPQFFNCQENASMACN